MAHFEFGDIVLLKFPFSDRAESKRRPAMVIKDTDDEDIIVCRITSQIYYSDFDIILENWKSVGLKLPSVVRVHKIAPMEKNMVSQLIGKINSFKIDVLKKAIQKLLN